MISFSLALCFSAFGCLCLAMPRHFEQALKRKPGPHIQRVLRLLGWLLLTLAIAPAVGAQGPSVGLTVWCALLSVAAVSQGLLLTYRPQVIAVASIAAPFLALPWLVIK